VSAMSSLFQHSLQPTAMWFHASGRHRSNMCMVCLQQPGVLTVCLLASHYVLFCTGDPDIWHVRHHPPVPQGGVTQARVPGKDEHTRAQVRHGRLCVSGMLLCWQQDGPPEISASRQ
jgi:hypothetical protein